MRIFKIILLLFLTSNLIAQDKSEEEILINSTIEIPEYRILYENMDNILIPNASVVTKNKVDDNIIEDISLTGKFIRKSNNEYVCKPPIGSRGKIVRFMTIVKFKNGNVKKIPSDPYTIKPAPSPNLYWGPSSDGGKASNSPILSVRYGNNVPFSPSKGKFEVERYEIMITGLKGVLVGKGNKIAREHLKVLKRCKDETKIAITCKFTGTFNGYITAMFLK